MNQLYALILINCTMLGNFYYLVLDDSVSKKWQIVVVIVQIILSIGIYMITELLPVVHNLFENTLNIFNIRDMQKFIYPLMFVINPFLIVMLVYFFSFQKSIVTKDRKLNKKQEQEREIKNELKKEEIICRVTKSSGMLMRFRGFEPVNTSIILADEKKNNKPKKQQMILN